MLPLILFTDTVLFKKFKKNKKKYSRHTNPKSAKIKATCQNTKDLQQLTKHLK